MKSTPTRTYVQRDRARAAEANTLRIYEAGLALFTERPFDQITLGAVAERAGVGLQTVIRRVGTKDGLVRAVGTWMVPQISAARGEPPAEEPRAVAEAVARQYERWGPMMDRLLRQEDATRRSPRWPSSAARTTARGSRRRSPAISTPSRPSPPRPPARLVGVTGVELWQVLRVVEGLSPEAATDAVADLITACLTTPHGRES